MKKTKTIILLEVGLLVALLLRYFKVLPNFEIITFMLVYITTVLNREIYYKKVNLYFLIILVMILSFGIPKLDWVNLIPFITYGVIVVSINLFSRKKLFLRTLYSVAVFFIVSNFLFWIFEPWQMYPRNLTGLLLCYMGALPFLKNQLISNLTASVAFSLALSGKFFEVESERTAETS
jgi:signal transduction histidine kinase